MSGLGLRVFICFINLIGHSDTVGFVTMHDCGQHLLIVVEVKEQSGARRKSIRKIE